MNVFRILAILAATHLIGCSGDPHEWSESAVEAEDSRASLPGRYRFVFDDARKQAVYAELGQRLGGAELEAAKREADVEAAQSVIEFTHDGRFISRIGDKVILEAGFSSEPNEDGSLTLHMGERQTTLRFDSEDRIVISDPKKGELSFERLR